MIIVIEKHPGSNLTTSIQQCKQSTSNKALHIFEPMPCLWVFCKIVPDFRGLWGIFVSWHWLGALQNTTQLECLIRSRVSIQDFTVQVPVSRLPFRKRTSYLLGKLRLRRGENKLVTWLHEIIILLFLNNRSNGLCTMRWGRYAKGCHPCANFCRVTESLSGTRE